MSLESNHASTPQLPAGASTPLGLMVFPAVRNADLDADAASYEPVPPRAVVAVSVEYRHEGRGRPLPYLDDNGGGA